jgi:hypothetical protein
VTELPPPAGGSYTIDEVKAALGFDAGCPIQLLPLAGGEALLVDEEGKLRSRPLNMGATIFAVAHGALFAGDYIVGDALHVIIRDGDWT